MARFVWRGRGVQEMLSNLTMGYGFAVSNGSFRPSHSTTAWIVEGQFLTNWVIGKIITPGEGKDHSTFCSKLGGLLGILIVLSHLQPATTSPTCQISCDGKSMFMRVQNKSQLTQKNPMQTSFWHAKHGTKVAHINWSGIMSRDIRMVRPQQS